MTLGVGGSNAAAELERLSAPAAYQPISIEERLGRIARAQRLMAEQGIDALFLEATTSLFYFTGLDLWASERLHGAVIPADGDLVYISPAFEEEKTRAMLLFGEEIRTWEEHQDPARLVVEIIQGLSGTQVVVGIDEAAPFFIYDALRTAAPRFEFVNGSRITGPCRIQKSTAEIALIQHAMDLTLAIQTAAARIMTEGISTTEVQQFLIDAHLKMGCDGPPPFRIVL
ncbi:MAG: aminopeptidase P family N-terminal domain-containing protein, partial [Arenicellales bacterium]|nr:aminopeptidase P family N-terminal domain-containing protein [Arenicellales bacterium]